LNLGIGDAMNLGWKLAAEPRGWAPDGPDLKGLLVRPDGIVAWTGVSSPPAQALARWFG
jgi:FAD binding domain